MHDSNSNYNFFVTILHMHHFWTLCILILYLFQLSSQTYGYIAYNVFPNQFTQLVANWIPYKNYHLGSNLKLGSQMNPTILVINNWIWSLFSTKKNGNTNLHTFVNLDKNNKKWIPQNLAHGDGCKIVKYYSNSM
jgi:hypothetical protein